MIVNNLKDLRKTYGHEAVFGLAYGSSAPVVAKSLKGKPRVVKKKANKLHRTFEGCFYSFGFDKAATILLKGKYKKGCLKGKSFSKVCKIKDNTIYLTVPKERENLSGNMIYEGVYDELQPKAKKKKRGDNNG